MNKVINKYPPQKKSRTYGVIGRKWKGVGYPRMMNIYESQCPAWLKANINMRMAQLTDEYHFSLYETRDSSSDAYLV